jgi:hypothetical protein
VSKLKNFHPRKELCDGEELARLHRARELAVSTVQEPVPLSLTAEETITSPAPKRAKAERKRKPTKSARPRSVSQAKAPEENTEDNESTLPPVATCVKGKPRQRARVRNRELKTSAPPSEAITSSLSDLVSTVNNLTHMMEDMQTHMNQASRCHTAHTSTVSRPLASGPSIPSQFVININTGY